MDINIPSFELPRDYNKNTVQGNRSRDLPQDSAILPYSLMEYYLLEQGMQIVKIGGPTKGEKETGEVG
jgi:hypothetical protein